MSTATAAPRFAGTAAQLWTSTAVRLVLGGVLVYAGGAKVTNPDQAVRAVQAYELLPRGLDQVVGYGLPLFEIALGVLLLLGLGTRFAAIVTGVLMLVFIAGVASAWARGLSIDCGCFGGGGSVSPEGKAWRYASEILRDLLFTAGASWLAVFPASRLALDRSGTAGTGDHGLIDDFQDDEDDEDDEHDDLDSATSTHQPNHDTHESDGAARVAREEPRA